MLHVGSWPGRCSTARCRGWLYNIKDKSTGNSGEASECISSGQIRLVCIAEVTSYRICLSPFTKDNRGCGLMNATMTQFMSAVRRLKQNHNGAPLPLIPHLAIRSVQFTASGGVMATCNPNGDTMPGVKSVLVLRPWLSKCDLGLSDPRQWLIAASVRRHGCRGF